MSAPNTPEPARFAESVVHPPNCICLDGEFCELQIDAYEELKALVRTTLQAPSFDLDDVIADQAIEAMYPEHNDGTQS